MERTTTTDAFMRGFYKTAFDAGLTPDEAAEMHAVAIINEAKMRSPDFARGFDKIASAAAAPKYSPEELEARHVQRLLKIYDRERAIAEESPGGRLLGRGEMAERGDYGLPVRRPLPTVRPREDPYGFLPSTSDWARLPRNSITGMVSLAPAWDRPKPAPSPTPKPAPSPAPKPAPSPAPKPDKKGLPSDNIQSKLKELTETNASGEPAHHVRVPSGVAGARG